MCIYIYNILIVMYVFLVGEAPLGVCLLLSLLLFGLFVVRFIRDYSFIVCVYSLCWFVCFVCWMLVVGGTPLFVVVCLLSLFVVLLCYWLLLVSVCLCAVCVCVCVLLVLYVRRRRGASMDCSAPISAPRAAPGKTIIIVMIIKRGHPGEWEGLRGDCALRRAAALEVVRGGSHDYL